MFFEEGARIFPEFLKMILADYKIQDNKFHIAGPSNGGIASFHVAAANPQYFLSVTAFPGYMWQPSAARLQAISKMCVFMYVGEFDEYRWHDEMKKEAEFLRAKGTVARYTVEKGQPHRLETLAGANAGTLVRRIRGDEEGLQQVARPSRRGTLGAGTRGSPTATPNTNEAAIIQGSQQTLTGTRKEEHENQPTGTFARTRAGDDGGQPDRKQHGRERTVTEKDKAEIHALRPTYGPALIGCKPEAWANLYATPGGYFASGPRGEVREREALMEMVLSYERCDAPPAAAGGRGGGRGNAGPPSPH